MVVIAAGIAGGLFGAAPGLWLARRARRGGRPSVAAGLAATLGSLALLTALVGLARGALGAAWAPFAASVVATFLGLWAVESLLAWRWMRRIPGEVRADG